jgi:hypothetical protein
MELSFLKQHPYATGAVVIIGGAGLFLVMRHNQTDSNDSTGDVSATVSALSLQQAQIQAAQSVQQSHDQTALAVEQAKAQAQIKLAESQVETARIIADSQVSQTQAKADVYTNYISMQEEVSEAALAEAQREAELNNQLALGIVSQQAALQNRALGIVEQTGLNHEGSKQQGIVQALSLALGQGGIESYNQSRAVASAADSAASASIVKSITDGASRVVTGLFGG